MDNLLNIAIECGAGITPNPCNSEMLITFTPHELQKFAEKLVAEQSTSDPNMEFSGDTPLHGAASAGTQG